MLEPKEETKIGTCEFCHKEEVEVIADGYCVAFVCESCYNLAHAIID